MIDPSEPLPLRADLTGRLLMKCPECDKEHVGLEPMELLMQNCWERGRREGFRRGRMELIERAQAFIQSEWDDDKDNQFGELYPYLKGMEDLLKYLTDPMREPLKPRGNE